MYQSIVIQADIDDTFIASTDTVGHVSLQIHPERGGGHVTLIFGALGAVNGLAVIDRIMAGFGELREELKRRALEEPPACATHGSACHPSWHRAERERMTVVGAGDPEGVSPDAPVVEP